MQEKRYSPDKPSDCSKCYFWKGKIKGCGLGEENCYYLITFSSDQTQSQCDGCPYGQVHPCIGWCTKKIMREIGLK